MDKKLDPKKTIKLYKKLKELEKQEARERYVKYVEYVHQGRWVPAKHLVYLCNKIQDFLNSSKEVLILQMPPQHGKSMSVTETLPSWFIGTQPEKRCIIACYNETFARNFGRRNKAKIKEFGKELFDIEVNPNVRSDVEFELKNGIGSINSKGLLSGITGKAADLIIIDDPIKNREEADSKTMRDKVWGEYLNSIDSRLSSNGKIILILTRWHEDDLAGRIMDTEIRDYELISFPCEAEENDILGRKKGDPLFPDPPVNKDKAWLIQKKKQTETREGARTWMALYQCRPAAIEGNLLKRQWWRFYEMTPSMHTKILSVDASFEDKDDSDFVCIQVWGKRGANCYLLENIKAKMDFPATIQTIRDVCKRNKDIGIKLIEKKASGAAIIQMLRLEMPGIKEVNPQESKVSRANAVSFMLETGNVWLPKYAAWVEDLLNECSAFPNGSHDDQVDAMTQALAYLKNISGGSSDFELRQYMSDLELEDEGVSQTHTHGRSKRKAVGDKRVRYGINEAKQRVGERTWNGLR